MKATKLVKTNQVQKVPKKVPKKVQPPVKNDDPIYGVTENSRWAKRLKQYNPEAYARLRNWD